MVHEWVHSHINSVVVCTRLVCGDDDRKRIGRNTVLVFFMSVLTAVFLCVHRVQEYPLFRVCNSSEITSHIVPSDVLLWVKLYLREEKVDGGVGSALQHRSI